jgi:F-type H+-transporting ATPase subunit a
MLDLMPNSAVLVLAAAEAEAGGKEAHKSVSLLGLSFYFVLVIAIVLALMFIAKPGIQGRYFVNRWTQRFEHLYLWVENLAVGIIGPHGRKYIPMVMTFWMVIFVSNVVALFFPTSPTADISFNLAMALIAIGYVQYEGMKSNGVIGHLSHFAGPKMGLALIPISVMLFCIELVSELMKNVSLTLRLYGNIDGGHRASDAMTALGKDLLGPGLSVPFGAFLMPIKMMTCVVQALIFCLLFCVYIGLVTHHEGDHDHGHEGDHGHGDAQPAPVH